MLSVIVGLLSAAGPFGGAKTVNSCVTVNVSRDNTPSPSLMRRERGSNRECSEHGGRQDEAGKGKERGRGPGGGVGWGSGERRQELSRSAKER